MTDRPEITDAEEDLPEEEFRRSWRLVTLAGCLGGIYYLLCLQGAPWVKFLTEIGATAFHFGLISALGSIAVGFQILGGFLSNRLRGRKTTWIVITVLHRAIFLAVLLAPPLFMETKTRLWWVISVVFLHDALAQTGTPMWLSWMADVLPRDATNRHWANRQRTTTAARAVAAIILAYGFDYFERTDQIVLGFTIIAAFGVVLGIIDIFLFIRVPEAPPARSRDARLLETFAQPLRDPDFRPFLVFMAYWTFAAALAWPFFNLYMIDFLEISVRDTQLVMMAGPIGMLLASPYMGILCDTYGQRPILQMALIGKISAPVAFLLAPRIAAVCVPLLAVVLFLDGILNAGFFVATQGIMFRYTPRRNRSMYIAATNFMAMGITAGIAPFIAGVLIDSLENFRIEAGIYLFTGYHLVFAASICFRVGANFFVKRLHDPNSRPIPLIIAHLREANPIRVGRAIRRLHAARTDRDRVRAILRLGQLGSSLAVHDLIVWLQSPNRILRRAAARALGRIGSSEASGPLGEALFDPESGIRVRAARALGEIGSVESLEALLGALRRLDKPALFASIDALVRIDDSAALLPLICLFDEVDDDDVRRHVALALGRLGEGGSVEEVMALLNPARPSTNAPRP